MQPLVAQIGWTHSLVIIQRCADPSERKFYVRMADENPSIGIILCKEKRRTIVEYALRDARKAIGVAVYRIVKRLPKELKGQLPSPEQMGKLLGDIR